MITPKAIVLQKTEIGELRVRADFEADFPEPAPHIQTLSRQVEGYIDPAVVAALNTQWDTVFALFEEGIPPAE